MLKDIIREQWKVNKGLLRAIGRKASAVCNLF